jgi:hypothetical protein
MNVYRPSFGDAAVKEWTGVSDEYQAPAALLLRKEPSVSLRLNDTLTLEITCEEKNIFLLFGLTKLSWLIQVK